MAISYNSKDASSAWPEGDYDAEITFVEELKSSKGADMWKLTIKVYNAEGREKTVTDFIVVPSTLFRLKQLAMAHGKGESFKANTFEPSQVANERMTVTLGIDPPTDKYDEKNVVKKYSAAVGKPRVAAVAAAPDEIKF